MTNHRKTNPESAAKADIRKSDKQELLMSTNTNDADKKSDSASGVGFEKKLHEFIAVPFEAVTQNGIYLRNLNTGSPGAFALVGPNMRAVHDEDGRPYFYRSLRACINDADKLTGTAVQRTANGTLNIQ